MTNIHDTDYANCDQRLLAIEAQEECPFCRGKGGFADDTDPESDWGCATCGAFVDSVRGWERSSRDPLSPHYRPSPRNAMWHHIVRRDETGTVRGYYGYTEDRDHAAKLAAERPMGTTVEAMDTESFPLPWSILLGDPVEAYVPVDAPLLSGRLLTFLQDCAMQVADWQGEEEVTGANLLAGSHELLWSLVAEDGYTIPDRVDPDELVEVIASLASEMLKDRDNDGSCDECGLLLCDCEEGDCFSADRWQDHDDR